MHSPINDLTDHLLAKFAGISFGDARSLNERSGIDEITRLLLEKLPGISVWDARAQSIDLWQAPAIRLNAIGLLALSARCSRPRLNPFVAEFFAQSVLRRLGIRTANETVICSAAEGREFAVRDFVVKCAPEEPPRNLSWNPTRPLNGTCLASRIVPNAATLNFVERKLFRSRVDKEEPTDRFYAGFEIGLAPAQIEAIKKAMDVDGSQYLGIFVARMFLGCSCTPHFKNVLVNRTGELISLDHAHAEFEDGEDLRIVFEFIERSSDAFMVLGAIAALDEKDIEASISEIPTHTVCGSVAGLSKYFRDRLQLWKQLYRP